MAIISSTPDLKIHLLGPPRLELRGSIVEPDTRKATAMLVAYLALRGERLSCGRLNQTNLQKRDHLLEHSSHLLGHEPRGKAYFVHAASSK